MMKRILFLMLGVGVINLQAVTTMTPRQICLKNCLKPAPSGVVVKSQAMICQRRCEIQA